MKRVILAAVCLVLMDGAAGAQQYTQWPGGITLNGGSSGRLAVATLTHTKTGDAALDRAVEICDAHQALSTIYPTYMPVRPAWALDYVKPCEVVDRAWRKSIAAKAEAERKQREVADKAFLDGFADGLGR